MSSIEVKQWECKLLKTKLWIIKIGKEYWFFAREIASALGYSDPRKTIKDRITDPEEKKSMEEILGSNYGEILEKSLKSDEDKISLSDFFQKIRGRQKLISEPILYYFCATSKKDKAKPFYKWVFNTIKEIRETGSYTLPWETVENPLDLITKVSSSFENEIQTLKKRIHTLEDQEKPKTCNKGTQTQQNSKRIIKNSLKNLENEIEKIRVELKISSKETNSCSSYSSSSSHYNSDSD